MCSLIQEAGLWTSKESTYHVSIDPQTGFVCVWVVGGGGMEGIYAHTYWRVRSRIYVCMYVCIHTGNTLGCGLAINYGWHAVHMYVSEYLCVCMHTCRLQAGLRAMAGMLSPECGMAFRPGSWGYFRSLPTVPRCTGTFSVREHMRLEVCVCVDVYIGLRPWC